MSDRETPDTMVNPSGYWSGERLELADHLVKELLNADVDGVIKDGLSAEDHGELIRVSNEAWEVEPLVYDADRLTPNATDKAIRWARGADE